MDKTKAKIAANLLTEDEKKNLLNKDEQKEIEKVDKDNDFLIAM